ncbi:MAG: GNAT family N-acetyltransferase [Candidatus Aenigmarchaeota archaeon]|nr:GNAT family N-acetyltransferase [Candidatus Aenigmarchaeota archaeon]
MAKIRLANEQDAPTIADIIKKHYEEDYMGYVTFNENYVKEKMKRNNFYFVAEVDNIVVGCLRASVVDIDLAEIRNICVEERFRNQGIATQLLQAALNILKEKHMRKIVARTIAWNDKAIKFFKTFGFEQEGLFKEHYRRGIDIIQLYKFLK